MECNVGGAERVLRTICGAAMVGTGLFAPVGPRMRAAALAVGAIELATAAARYCPLNAALGRSSCRTSSRWGRGVAALRGLRTRLA